MNHLYCCYFDHRYLPRGLAMIRSLKRWQRHATVWVLCLSEDCHRVLTEIAEPRVHLLRTTDLELAYPALGVARSNRTLIEYYFTCTPSLIRFVLDQAAPDEIVTYVDSDLYFFADPEEPLFRELGDGAVSIIPHRFPSHLKHLEKYGLYNVGWMSFRNDARGNAVATWWQDRCNEWCYDVLEGERFADQKYLDRIATDFEGVVIIGHPGANLAPWNLANHQLTLNGSRVVLDGRLPLLFFHFHGLRRSGKRMYIPGHFRYKAPFSRLVRESLYKPYIRELEDIALETAGYFAVPKRTLARQASERGTRWEQVLGWVRKPAKDTLAILRREFVLVPRASASQGFTTAFSRIGSLPPGKLRIVIVHNYYGSSAPSGENAVVDTEIAMLRRAGHEVHVFIRRSDEIREEGWRGLAHGGLTYTWNPFELLRFRRYLRVVQPDIVHVHNTFPLISPAVFWIIGEVAASVLTLHNYRVFCASALLLRDGAVCTRCLDESSVLPALRYGCYRGSRLATMPVAQSIALHKRIGTWRSKVDAFITMTEFQRDRMVTAGLPAGRVHVKPNFFIGSPPLIPWPERNDRALYVGRLSPEKGVDVLIGAWIQLGERAPPLRIVGDGPLRAALQQRVRDSGSTRIEFLGAVPQPRAVREIAATKLLLVPSIGFEGFPIVLQEAFASGTPAAVSAIGAMPTIIRDGVNGLLFEVGDAASIAALVTRAWQDSKLLERLSAGARASFESSYTEEINRERLMQIYSIAIDRRRAAAA